MSSLSSEILEQLLAVSKRLTARRDLDSLLHDILDGSLQLIPGADFACVFLYRGEDNVLVPVGGVGFDMTYMKTVWLKPGESLTGQAFVEKKPLLLATPPAVKHAQQTLSPEHERAVKLAVGRPDNPVRSSLAVPLIVQSRTVGVLVIDNYDTDRDFTSVDLSVATILSDHAAIAVANAQDYQRAKNLSRELQQTLSIQRKLLSSMLTPSSGIPEILGSLWHLIRRPHA
ncbi:MAG: GAF domain-containing protein, partial [Firmicutes bacterium]|nr:GAF domain-containing protein [Bacillota bacterium]